MSKRPLLAAVDFSPLTPLVFDVATELAKLYGTHLVVAHVAPPDPEFVGYEPGPDTVRREVAQQYREEHRQLEELANRGRVGGVRVTPLLLQGSIAETILRKADDLSARAIVVGSHGHGALYHLIVGSVSEGVLRGARCPVVVVPHRAACSSE